MNYPLISEYVEAIKLAEDNLDQLSYLRPVLDDEGRPVMSSGNFAVVFKMKDEQDGKFYALKCFIKDQEGRNEAYKLIADELESISSPFMLPIKYFEKELYVNTTNSSESEFPILLMDWIDGMNLQDYIAKIQDKQHKLLLLSDNFSMLAIWLLSQEFAHGDIKPDNILINPVSETPVLVDYDGMYVPAMSGSSAREMGSPDYRHPLRTPDYFNKNIDDFSLAVIQLYLDSLCANCKLDYPLDINSFVLGERDYVNITNSESFDLLKNFFYDSRFVRSYTRFLELLEAQESYNNHKGHYFIPSISDTAILYWKESIPEKHRVWIDSDNVKYSENWESLLNFPYNSSLEEYRIKYGCRVISDNAFQLEVDWDWKVYYYGNKLKRIIIPDTVEEFGSSCFQGCEELVYLNAPIGLRIIGDGSLSSCNKLRHFRIPRSVSQIGKDAFSDCIRNIKSDSPFFISTKDCLYSNDGTLLWINPELERFSIPEGITHISIGSLNKNSLLKVVTLPSSLKQIDFYGFFSNMESIASNSSSFISSRDCLYTDEGVLIWVNPKSTSVVIPEGVIHIPSKALSKCDRLEEIHFPTTLQEIEGNDLPSKIMWVYSNSKRVLADKDCIYTSDGKLLWVRKDILYFEFPRGIDSIEKYAFSGCSSLRNLTIPSSIHAIKEYIGRCANINWIYLTDSISYIKRGSLDVIYDYDNIKYPISCHPTLYIPKGTKERFLEMDYDFDEDRMIESESVITSSSILPGDNELPYDEIYCTYDRHYYGRRMIIFGSCSITEYSVKEGTEVVCDNCFNDMYWEIEKACLLKLHLPSSIRIIGHNSLCISSLETITCDSPLFKVDNSALLSSDGKVFYRYFGKQKNYTIPDSVETIIGGAFTELEMESITIPSKVKNIGDNPFAGIFKIENEFKIVYQLKLKCESPYFEIVDDCLIEKTRHKLIAYLGNKKDVVIHSQIEIVGTNSFFAKSCENVYFESKISQIEDLAFEWCMDLQHIYLTSSNKNDPPTVRGWERGIICYDFDDNDLPF